MLVESNAALIVELTAAFGPIWEGGGEGEYAEGDRK